MFSYALLWSSLQLLEVTTKERFIRYKVKDSQLSASVRLPACSVVTGTTVTGVIIVMDAWSLVSSFRELHGTNSCVDAIVVHGAW